MKKLLIGIFLLFSTCVVSAYPLNGKPIGIIGASATDGCEAPSSVAFGSPAFVYCLRHGSYLDMKTALTAKTNYPIVSAAQAGAWSYNHTQVTNVDYGYMAQYWQVDAPSYPAMSALIIDVVSECSGGLCSTTQENTENNTIQSVIDKAKFRNPAIKIIITGYPVQPNNTCFNQAYASRFKVKWNGTVSGVTFVEPYNNIAMDSTDCHPTTAGMQQASTTLVNAINSLGL